VKFIVGLLSVLLFPLTAAAEEIDAKAVDALVEEALKAFQVPGAAVAIVKDDRVVYLKGHGVRELGGDQKVTPDTLFAIASVTKSFTAASVAVQVDDGKMAWDDPVRKHLDYFRLADPLANEQATLRDLLCHRTDLASHALLWADSPWGREELIRRIGRVKLSQPFRTTWQYGNFMYMAAGQALGAAAKSSWEEVVQKRLFDPLGMTGATFSPKVAEKAANHASPHRKDKAGVVKNIPWRNTDVIGPAGSIIAHVRDMAQWVRFQLGDGTFDGKRLLSAAQLREPHTPQIVMSGQAESIESFFPDPNFFTYGLGWFINDYRTHVVVWHGGNIDGFTAWVGLVPKAKLGIVILSNQDQTPMPYALQHNLLDHLLGLPKKDWNTWCLAVEEKLMAKQKASDKERDGKRHQGTKPSRALDAYTGSYEEPAYGEAILSLKDGVLQLQWNRFKSPLQHFHFDTFVTNKDDGPPYLQNQQIVFTLGGDGEVASLRMFDMDFKKVAAKTMRD
jgi:CubicO group peptidase (beta-lactamase class C family)